ncbi:MAG: histidine phosphatase family protein [Candidatus Tyrphobacter sp.]
MIILCRHGATDENTPGRFLSRSDPPLNAAGRAQCERLRDVLSHVAVVDAAFVSPLRRCVESLAIIAPTAAFEVCDVLREVDFGQWDGRTRDCVARGDPKGHLALRASSPATFRPPGGESFADVATRLRPFANIARADARNLLIVGHRGTLGVLERLLRSLPLDSHQVAPLGLGEFRLLDLN